MNYPKSLLDIVRKATIKHRGNIDTAVDVAEKAWLDCPEYAEYVQQMVRDQIRTLIQGMSHRENIAGRKALGVYGQPAKVTLATGAVARVAHDYLVSYTICGVVLGKITGKQLVVFAKTEQQKADGSAFNARLCRRLAEIVPEDKAVADVLSAKKVKSIMAEVSGKRGRKTAAA